MTLRDDCEVTKRISNSVVKSFKKYLDSCEYDTALAHIPEYWFTVKIHDALENMPKRFSFLENSVQEIREYSKGKRPGKIPVNMRHGGRVDICLWSTKWNPKAIIEVKKGWSWDQTRFAPDIDRIESCFDNFGKRSGGTLKAGYFVVVSECWAKNKKQSEDYLKKRQKRYEDGVSKKLAYKFSVKSDLQFTKYHKSEDDEEHWLGAAHIFKIEYIE